MTDKRVVVPEGMLEAGRKALYEDGFSRSDALGAAVAVILEAALNWLCENPPILPDNEWVSCWSVGKLHDGYDNATIMRCLFKRIFRAPDPPFDPSLGGCLTGRTFTQKEADLIKEYIQRSVPLGMVR